MILSCLAETFLIPDKYLMISQIFINFMFTYQKLKIVVLTRPEYPTSSMKIWTQVYYSTMDNHKTKLTKLNKER